MQNSAMFYLLVAWQGYVDNYSIRIDNSFRLFCIQKLGLKGVCVNALHPGNMVSSSIARNWWFYRLLFAFVRPFTKSLVGFRF